MRNLRVAVFVASFDSLHVAAWELSSGGGSCYAHFMELTMVQWLAVAHTNSTGDP